MYCYINKIKNKISNLLYISKITFLKYFSKFLKIIPIIILIGLFLVLSLKFFNSCDIHNPTNVETQEIYIYGISLNNWVNWITLIGLFFTALWSMHQYTKSKLSSQQEKASQIATTFADNLIEKMGLISKTLLDNTEIQKIVNTFNKNPNCLSQFTTYEIIDILKDDQIFEKYTNILHSNETQEKYIDFLNKKYSTPEQDKFNNKFPVLVESTLNHLEAICINISSQAAGSQFIYNSLHQNFLKTVKILAIIISKNNDNNVDKYYTNIIQVYNMWNKEKNKDIKRFKRTQKKINKMQKKADLEIKKLLSKENKTV